MSEKAKGAESAEGAISPEQFKALMAQVNSMGQQLAVISQRNQELEEAAKFAETGGVLPEEEQPTYEVLNPQGFNAPDQFYPEGTRFTDIYGCLLPNDQFLPLNRAAEERMDAYLKSLPGQVRTPPLDFVLEAAHQLRNMEGTQAEFYLATAQQALELASKHGAKIQISDPITRPVKLSNIPLMTNSRINGVEPARAPAATRYRGEGAGPADRFEPAMTGNRTELLGRFAPPRVRAG